MRRSGKDREKDINSGTGIKMPCGRWHVKGVRRVKTERFQRYCFLRGRWNDDVPIKLLGGLGMMPISQGGRTTGERIWRSVQFIASHRVTRTCNEREPCHAPTVRIVALGLDLDRSTVSQFHGPI